MQSAKVLQNTKNAEILGKMIADKIKEQNLEVEMVVAPAMGGLIIGHEVASSLGKDFVFTERVDGEMLLRRGFEIAKGTKIALIEDVFTTGKSTREVITLLDSMGVSTVCCCSIVDRSGGNVSFGLPKISLLTLDIKSYQEQDCPMCKKGLKIERPGSRFLKK
jgi:orotate phosphoribosyltransferase